jgi:hypothetical protein
VRAPLVFLVTRVEVATVIANEDEDRVLSEMFLFKNLPNVTNGVVEGFDAAT